MNKIKLTSILLTALTLIGSENTFSQTNKTKQTMKQTNETPVYLDKNDSLFITIKDRAITDLKEWIRKMDPNSPEGKLMGEKVQALSKEKQGEMNELAQRSIGEYTTQANLDEAIFMMVLGAFKEMSDGGMVEKWKTRVRSIDSNKYMAEFWADGQSVNEDISLVLELHKMSDEYADKSINDGKQEQYSKVMVLLYTQETDGSINFNNPFQPMIDFINKY
jgi:hypothetical protein